MKTYDFLVSSIKAKNFLLSVIHTPDASPYDTNETRLVPLVFDLTDEKGKKVPTVDVIEKRWLYGSVENDYGRYSRLGTYLDKAFAANFLTQRLDSRDYSGDATTSIRFSFLDFERVLGIAKAEDSPIVQTLAQMLMDDLQPMLIGSGNDAYSFGLNYNYQADVSSFMRYYAAVNSTLNLYVDSIEQGFNYASKFRVNSMEGFPSWAGKDFKSIVDLSVPEDHRSERRYYATGGEQSSISNVLITQAVQMRQLLDTEGKRGVKKALDEYIAAYIAEKLNPTKPTASVPRTNGPAGEASAPPSTSSVTLKPVEVKRAALLKVFGGIYTNPQEAESSVGLVEAYVDAVQQQFVPAVVALSSKGDQASMYAMKLQVQRMNNSLPVVGIVTDSLNRLASDEASAKVLQLNPGAFQFLLPSEPLRWKYGIVKGNLDLVNRLYSLLEPAARND
jgi:hypothetical protein